MCYSYVATPLYEAYGCIYRMEGTLVVGKFGELPAKLPLAK